MINGYDITINDLPDDLAEIADQIGLEPTLKLVEARGGESIYIHKKERVVRMARDRQICAEFNGSNHAALAQQYGLTVSRIRDILNEKRKKDRCGRKEWQMDLPLGRP